jgi:hypothetical protein
LLGLWSESHSFASVSKRSGLLALGWEIGLGASALFIIPLLEFIDSAYSGSIHGEHALLGLQHLPLREIVFFGVPYFEGLPRQVLASGVVVDVEDYTGAGLLALACVGVTTLVNPSRRKRPVLFAVAASIVIAGKIYGMPLLNELGRLPFFSITYIYLWAQPLLVFSLALIASHAIQEIASGRLPRRYLTSGAVLFSLYLIISIYLNWDIIRQVEPERAANAFAGAAAAGYLAIWVAFLLIRSRPRFAAISACLIVVVELFVLAPHGVYEDRTDALAEPPFVDYVKQQSPQQPFRIFSTQSILYPDFAEAFDLDDIRSLEALYPSRYLTFINEFIQPNVTDFNRFTGVIEHPGQPPVVVANNKWINLANVRYLLLQSGSSPYQNSDLAAELAGGSGNPDVASSPPMKVDGVTLVSLLEHSTSSVADRFVIDDDHTLIEFLLAIDPRAWDASTQEGVTFTIDVTDEEGVHNVFQRNLNPTHNPADQHWIPGKVDLSPFLGKSVEIRFSTRSLEDNADEWGAWGELHFEPASGKGQFVRIYTGEVDVYENRLALPRAFLVDTVTAAASSDAAVQLMRAPGFDPRSSAIVEDAPDSELEQVDAGPLANVGGARVLSYAEQDMTVSVSTDAPALLVVTDSYFPGWDATLDGQQVATYPTDVAFRGVIVPAGTHQVVFRYRPFSFTLGVIVTFLAIGSLLLAVLRLGPPRLSRKLP